VKLFPLLPAVLLGSLGSLPICALAGSATWNLDPISNDWSTAVNWTPATVPNGPNDTATFEQSNQTNIKIPGATELNGIVFNPGASAFTLSPAIAEPGSVLTVSGAGIVNNSALTQNLVMNATSAKRSEIDFTNNATASAGITITNNGNTGGYSAGGTRFFDSASAGEATIVNNAVTGDDVTGGAIYFNDSSSAGNATLVNLGIVGSLGFGDIRFYDNSTAGNATVMNNGSIFFHEESTAGNANFILHHQTEASVNFYESSTAGDAVFTTDPNTVIGFVGDVIAFVDTSDAGSATFTIEGGGVAGADGQTLAFAYDSSAQNGNFTVNGASASGAGGGVVLFAYSAHAANATFTINGGTTSDAGGGELIFAKTVLGYESHADNAILIANPGASITFAGYNTGDMAQIKVFGSGQVDVSDRSTPTITFGSIEGSGVIRLGSSILAVGGNNLSTDFTGTITDGGSAGGSGGSLVKTGTGSLSLWNASTYTGSTNVNNGILLANCLKGSCTGKGPVVINAGTFGGRGRVNGPVTIGTGSGPGAILAPGAVGMIPGTFTIQKNLQFLADATLKILMQSDDSTTDAIAASGIRIRNARIALSDRGTTVLPAGTTFTLLSNTGGRPISGTFINLPDDGTITVGSNTFQANYEGGDGNDLTLTVVGN